MHREPLLRTLDAYVERFADEQVRVDHMRQFVCAHTDCFERTCVEGHMTGAAWILSADHRQVLLVQHRKLCRWLQVGGHADGDSDLFRVALREAREESGLVQLALVSGTTTPVPFDIDVHQIPARAGEAAHLHYDLRYLFVAAAGQTPCASSESTAVQWVDRGRLPEFSTEESVLRMERKTRMLLGAKD